MNTINKYLKYFGLILVAVFFILGFLLIFSDYFLYIPKNIRIIFASIIMAYGAFRLVTIVYKPKVSEDDEE
jgi:hypothetical protein